MVGGVGCDVVEPSVESESAPERCPGRVRVYRDGRMQRVTPLRLFVLLTAVFWVATAAGASAELRPFDAGGAFFGAACISAAITPVWWFFYSSLPNARPADRRHAKAPRSTGRGAWLQVGCADSVCRWGLQRYLAGCAGDPCATQRARGLRPVCLAEHRRHFDGDVAVADTRYVADDAGSLESHVIANLRTPYRPICSAHDWNLAQITFQGPRGRSLHDDMRDVASAWSHLPPWPALAASPRTRSRVRMFGAPWCRPRSPPPCRPSRTMVRALPLSR